MEALELSRGVLLRCVLYNNSDDLKAFDPCFGKLDLYYIFSVPARSVILVEFGSVEFDSEEWRLRRYKFSMPVA